MGNNVNLDRKRFRYSGVDRANASHAQFSTKAMAMHCKKTPSFEVDVEHDSHYETGCLFYDANNGRSVTNAVRVLLFIYQSYTITVFFLSNWICVCFYVQERIFKNVDFWKSYFFKATKLFFLLCDWAPLNSEGRSGPYITNNASQISHNGEYLISSIEFCNKYIYNLMPACQTVQPNCVEGLMVCGIVYGDMYYKELLGSIERVGYCIPILDFYIVLHGVRCWKSTQMD